MTPKTLPQNCETPGHCDDHSGLLAWMKGIAIILSIATGLLSFSVFWQAPNLRLEMLQIASRLDAKDTALDYRIQTIEKDLKCVTEKVTMLTEK